MTEQRLAEIEDVIEPEGYWGKFAQELIDEVRFLRAALADARKELDASLNDRLLKLANQPVGAGDVNDPTWDWKNNKPRDIPVADARKELDSIPTTMPAPIIVVRNP